MQIHKKLKTKSHGVLNKMVTKYNTEEFTIILEEMSLQKLNSKRFICQQENVFQNHNHFCAYLSNCFGCQ